jgi:hypothetical protein
MRRLQPEEVQFHIPLNIYDPLVCKKAVAYTLTPVEDEPGWDEVTYYGDPSSSYDVSPLELMLNEWNTQK